MTKEFSRSHVLNCNGALFCLGEGCQISSLPEEVGSIIIENSSPLECMKEVLKRAADGKLNWSRY